MALGSGRALVRLTSVRRAGIFIGQVLQAIIASLVVQGALQKRVKSEKDFSVYQNQLTVMMNITMNVIYISLANIPTFFAEKIVCVSEQAEGLYSGLAYLLASTVSSIPVAALSILAGTLIQYLITGPDPVYYRWYLFPEVSRGVRATTPSTRLIDGVRRSSRSTT